MSYNNHGGGRFLDPELQDQLEAAKALSASFTRAGENSRPGRGSRTVSRGGRSSPFQSGPPRPSISHGGKPSTFPPAPLRLPTAGINLGPRPSQSATRFGTSGFGAGSRPTINPPVFKSASPLKSRSSGMYDGGASPPKFGGNGAFGNGNTSNAPAMIGSLTVGPINCEAPGNTHTGFMAPTVNVTATSNFTPVTTTIQGIGASEMANNFNSTAVAAQAPQNHPQAAHNTSIDGRELIVTNWTEDYDKKPFIPAHLQQKSTFQAIQEMADMIDQPVDAITFDGVSIPRPREGARPLIPPFHPAAHASAPRQPDVDPTGWFIAARSNTNASTPLPSFGGPTETTGNSRAVSSGAMDINTDGGGGGNAQLGGGNGCSAPTTRVARADPIPAPPAATIRPQDLSGSIWSDASWKLPIKKENVRPQNNNFAYGPKLSKFGTQGTSAPPNSFGGNFGFNVGTSNAPSSSANPGSAPHASASRGFSAPAPAQEKKTKTLADSMWA